MTVALGSAAARSSRGLAVLAYARGFTLWHYQSAAPMAEVRAPGHFLGLADMIAPGDMIVIQARGETALMTFDRDITATPFK